MPDYEIVTPRPVRPLIDALKGKRLGYADLIRDLKRNPCDSAIGAYRLSGPLGETVCGAHLRRQWRIAFTMQPPAEPGATERVVILYVGKREPRHRDSDIWTVLHGLFGVKNPPEDHHKPACCACGNPRIDDEALDDFLRQLRRFVRGR